MLSINVKNARLITGLSVNEFAMKCDLPRASVFDIETGRVKIRG